jgi:hypothetical protein
MERNNIQTTEYHKEAELRQEVISKAIDYHDPVFIKILSKYFNSLHDDTEFMQIIDMYGTHPVSLQEVNESGFELYAEQDFSENQMIKFYKHRGEGRLFAITNEDKNTEKVLQVGIAMMPKVPNSLEEFISPDFQAGILNGAPLNNVAEFNYDLAKKQTLLKNIKILNEEVAEVNQAMNKGAIKSVNELDADSVVSRMKGTKEDSMTEAELLEAIGFKWFDRLLGGATAKCYMKFNPIGFDWKLKFMPLAKGDEDLINDIHIFYHITNNNKCTVYRGPLTSETIEHVIEVMKLEENEWKPAAIRYKDGKVD